MTADDYAIWRDNPVTKWVMHAIGAAADECRENWLAASWDTGSADQSYLDKLQSRAGALVMILNADFEDIEAWHDEHERN